MPRTSSSQNKLPYSITIAEDFSLLRDLLLDYGVTNKKVLILTDHQVKKIYFNELESCVPKELNDEVYLYSINSGERYKSIKTCENIYKFLIDNNFSRNDLIIAFGGGIGAFVNCGGIALKFGCCGS